MGKKYPTKERISDEPRLTDAIDKMAKTIDLFFDQIRNIRVGNVTTAVIDSVRVQYHGQKTPIMHLARTSGGRGKPISIEPYDPSLVSQINKDLIQAGFSSYVFSKTTVCVNVPPMSGEERDKICNHVKKIGEDSKIAIRNIRKQFRNSLKDLTQDERLSAEKLLQENTDSSISLINEGVDDKVSKL